MKTLIQRFAEITIGLGLASSVWLGWLAFDQWNKARYPVSDIFEATVIVPDFKASTDPIVIYDRSIKRSFIGSFTVEIKGSDGVTKCSGTGKGFKYDAGEAVDPKRVTLSWYTNDNCTLRLPVGQYFAETTYSIDVEGLPRKYLTTVSNFFSVEP